MSLALSRGGLNIRRINNHVVQPIMLPVDNRKIRAADICAEPYANIFLVGKKKSGKSSVINHFLKHFIGRHTTVIVFCSTVFKDKNWIEMRKWMKKKGIDHECYASLYDENGVNKLQEIIQGLEDEAKEKEEALEEEKDETSALPQSRHQEILRLLGGPKPEQKEKKEKKEKLLSPEFIFIFDDLSHQSIDPSIAITACKNRHFLCKTIISSQYLHHLKPEARKQIDLYIIFKGLPFAKIKEVAKDADVSIPVDKFWDIYKKATVEKHSFLYLSTGDDEMRRNLCDTIILPDDYHE